MEQRFLVEMSVVYIDFWDKKKFFPIKMNHQNPLGQFVHKISQEVGNTTWTNCFNTNVFFKSKKESLLTFAP